MSAGEDLIVRLHQALDRQDLDAVMAMFHPEARFGDPLDDGEIVGPAGVRAFYRRLFDTLSPGVDVLAVTALPDGRLQAELQVSVRDRAGKFWSDSKTLATYTLRDGLISAVELADEGKRPR
jgi:hypothetical protein